MRERLREEFFFRWEGQEMCTWVMDIWCTNQVDGARQKIGGRDFSHVLEMSWSPSYMACSLRNTIQAMGQFFFLIERICDVCSEI